MILAALLSLSMDTAHLERTPLLTPAQVARAAAWRSVHDRVMGGVSAGEAVPAQIGIRLAGTLSLENNGGFASFRRDVSWPDLAQHDGVRLRVRGDGKTYKLGLRTERGSGSRRAVDWQASFATRRDRWIDVELPFAELVPTWRGRLVIDAPPFDPTAVRELGILIADGQAGDFMLELASVEAWRTHGGAPGSRGAFARRTREVAHRIGRGAGAPEILEALRGAESLLVVASPDGLDARSSVQLGRMHVAGTASAERELRLVRLVGDEAGRMAGRTLGPETVRALRQRWSLPSGAWTLALVHEPGDAGAAVERWTEPVDADTLLARVRAGASGSEK